MLHGDSSPIVSCARTLETIEKPEKSVEWAGHTFRKVRTLYALPASLQAALGVGNPGLDGMADGDGVYSSTDVITFDFPRRRFLVAGVAGDATLVAIEHRGRGWRVEVRLFSSTDGKEVVEGEWTLFECPRTLRGLVDQLSPDKELPINPDNAN
jgi:hypothetical protein